MKQVNDIIINAAVKEVKEKILSKVKINNFDPYFLIFVSFTWTHQCSCVRYNIMSKLRANDRKQV